MQQVDVAYSRWIWRIHSRYVCVLDTTWFIFFTHPNPKQFNAALRVLFYTERPEDRVLQKYTDIGAFVLAIHNGREYFQLTGQDGWERTIQSGMTIVMSVIMTEEVYEAAPTKYECLFCECWNKLKGDNGQSSIDWWVLWGSVQLWRVHSRTLSRSCKRQFQVTPPNEGTYKLESVTVANDERDLIQNIYLKQKVRTGSRLGWVVQYWARFNRFEHSVGE